MGNVLEIKNVCKTYTSKKGIVYANKDISFDLSENEILAVLGTKWCRQKYFDKTNNWIYHI